MTARAGFLAGSGALVVTFALPPAAGAQAVRPTPPSGSEANPRGPIVYPEVDSWLAIDRAGRVTIAFGKVELGTGVETAVAQLAADELDVPFARVRIVQGDTDRTPNQGYTAGSQTLTSGAIPVRQAAAVARARLLQLGAQQLGVPESACSTRDGAVVVTAEPVRRVGYGMLIGGRRFEERVPKDPPMRPPSSFRVSGTSVPRVDIPAKIFGTAVFAQDVRVPRMLHARVIYPPAPGASLAGYDASSLAGLPEHVRIVRRENFLAVVARSEWHAVRAARELRVRWNDGPPLPPMAGLPDVVRATPGDERTLVDRGDTTGPFAGDRTLSAAYSWPFQSHGSIGPSCAVADVRPDAATIWASTQGVFPLRDGLAHVLDLPPGAVRVVYVEGAGCYGQNGADDAACAAALLSREVGAPVRVQYMRVDETRWDPKGPAMVIALRGALDAGSAIAAWETHVWSPSHSQRPDGKAGNLLPARFSGTPPEPARVSGEDRNEKINYRVPAQHIVITDQKGAVLRQSALRGLGGTQNSFANESFMDELAHLAGADPIDFRLRHLDDPRERAVLEAVRPFYRRGRGVAWVRYENTQAIVAAVADVSVNRTSGAVRVTQLWIAHDCGMIVNPDGLRNQIEGNAIQATSRALLEQVAFGPHEITSVDWRTYPILRFDQVPQVNVTLLDRRDERVLGAGEATTTVVAPAIANAIFAQTGARLRSVPFTPQAVRSALPQPR